MNALEELIKLLSDELLARQALQGDLSAFEELVNRYKNPVFAIAYRIIGQFQESEDITQEVLLSVYQKLYQFDQSKKFRPWIQRIAVNASISSLRRKKKIVNLSFEEGLGKDIDHYLTVHVPDPHSEFEKKELMEEIQTALLQVNDGYRVLLILRYQMDLDNQEIADILGVSRENVEVRIHRARKALRRVVVKQWTERGLSHELPASN
ncbi:MAG TPA: sigma-70 family RNA polymerase sigma factor [Syntrophomonadaceae bacterium]|nr:sigma-70 family RNA polymerase sigma factor [Syntrophomonadaceae bacterium]